MAGCNTNTSVRMKQRAVIKFLAEDNVLLVDIHGRMKVLFRQEKNQ
jgi:hypothetical protein